jgi:hypothetical protein
VPALDSARAVPLLAYLLLHRDAPQQRHRLAFLLLPLLDRSAGADQPAQGAADVSQDAAGRPIIGSTSRRAPFTGARTYPCGSTWRSSSEPSGGRRSRDDSADCCRGRSSRRSPGDPAALSALRSDLAAGAYLVQRWPGRLHPR